MGAQIDHGTAAAFVCAVKVGRKPVANGTVVAVAEAHIVNLAQLPYCDVMNSDLVGIILPGQGDDKLYAVAVDGFFYFGGTFVGKGKNLLGKDVFTCVGKPHHYIHMGIGCSADDGAFGIALQQLVQRGKNLYTEFITESIAKVIIFFPYAYHFAKSGGFFIIAPGMDMPQTANCYFHSKYTGFPVLSDT